MPKEPQIISGVIQAPYSSKTGSTVYKHPTSSLFY